MEKTKKAFRLQCLFNSIWDGAMKTVDFRAGSAAASVELNGNECRIPSKCLELGGVPLKIRIRGEKDGRKLITNWCQTNKILYNIVSRSSPSANLYDEFINALSGLTDSNPATRVSYPAIVDNADFAPAAMDFDNDTFNYGGWPENAGEKFMPRPCMLKFDGTVDYYLDPDDYTKKADGTASDIADVAYEGNAMMEWPKIFTKRWEENGVYHFRCSDAKIDDSYECWSNYDKNDNQIDHFYTPIYFGSLDSSNRLRSISGTANMVSKTAQNEIDYAKANGEDHWYTEVAADQFLIQDLLVMIGKSTDGQKTFGYGRCASSNSNAISSGTMNDKGLFWGSSDKTSGVKVFGMENWWGNLRRRIAGWIYKTTGQLLKLTRGTKDGSTATDYNTTGNGYLSVSGSVISANNYISGMKTKDFGRLPVTCSGSSTTYEADYAYRGTSADNTYYAYCGGNWGNDLYAGPFFVDLGTTPSSTYASLGAALSCKPLAAA